MSEEKKHVRKQAVALTYHHESMNAPIITAKGKGKLAETIIDRAIENQVPIMEDPSLVNLLTKLNVNDQIPEELYQAVAEVFAFIYETDKVVGEKGKSLTEE